MNLTLNSSDEIVMKLLHYFITTQGYSPVILHGAKDEIWLEKSDADYKIIRIVSNYIHNDEQLDFDIFRTKQILKKIKKKMFSLNMEALSIFVNLGDNVNLKNKDFDNIKVAEIKKIGDLSKYPFIINKFPNILEVENVKEEGLELFIKLTDDINKKNVEETKKAEEIFAKKRPIMTYIFLFLNIITYILCVLYNFGVIDLDIFSLGCLIGYKDMSSPYQLYRLITSVFLHANIIHLLCNMYSLYIIGSQLESFFGKIKYSIIYIGSAIVGNLLSIAFFKEGFVSVGASGAIFGLLGALLYFGYHYRVYLGSVLKNQLIPIILLNLALGFMLKGVDNFAHIGGLIGGIMISSSLGVKNKSTTFEKVNGTIITLIFTAVLIYVAFVYSVRG